MFELIFPFDDPLNYIFDPAKVEVNGGVAKLVDQGGGVYPTDNPTIEINYSFAADTLAEFLQTVTTPANTKMRWIFRVNSTWYYWDGAAWVVSDETFSQANNIGVILTNFSSLISSTSIIRVRAFLNSDDGVSTPELEELKIKYNFGTAQDSLSLCTVYGYARDENGEISTTPFSVYLNKEAVTYKDNVTIIKDVLTVTPRESDGFWEISLIENQNMSQADSGYYPTRYIFEMGGEKKCRFVPNQPSIEFGELENLYYEI